MHKELKTSYNAVQKDLEVLSNDSVQYHLEYTFNKNYHLIKTIIKRKKKIYLAIDLDLCIIGVVVKALIKNKRN